MNSRRRHRNKFCLHTPAGRILRIFETASDRNAFGRRDLIENLGAFFCRQVLEDRYSVVGFDLAYPLCNRLWGQFIEDFLAGRSIDPALLFNIGQAYRLRAWTGDCSRAADAYKKFIAVSRDVTARYLDETAKISKDVSYRFGTP